MGMRTHLRRAASGGVGGAALWRPPGNAQHTRSRSLNYRHSFHAGNFGDVLKHSVLVATLRHMHRKDKPMLLLDTHASRGVFALTSPEATRSPEHLHGALRRIEREKSVGERVSVCVCACVCVCVCVCESEREREREKEREKKTVCERVCESECVCVRERDRKLGAPRTCPCPCEWRVRVRAHAHTS